MGNGSSKSNDRMIDLLVNRNSIKSNDIERAFRLVDRGFFIPQHRQSDAYRAVPLKVTSDENGPFHPGCIHLCSPDVYSCVLEDLDIKQGHSFLNIGSGTGYLSTVVGFLIGDSGVNHGIEHFLNMVEYADRKADEYCNNKAFTHAFPFARPQFFHCNVFAKEFIDNGQTEQYDRIFCSAQLLNERVLNKLLRKLVIGGKMIVPYQRRLYRFQRVDENKCNRYSISRGTFTDLVQRTVHDPPYPCQLPGQTRMLTLAQLSRNSLRGLYRSIAMTETGEIPVRLLVDKKNAALDKPSSAPRRRRLVARRRRGRPITAPAIISSSSDDSSDSDPDPQPHDSDGTDPRQYDTKLPRLRRHTPPPLPISPLVGPHADRFSAASIRPIRDAAIRQSRERDERRYRREEEHEERDMNRSRRGMVSTPPSSSDDEDVREFTDMQTDQGGETEEDNNVNVFEEHDANIRMRIPEILRRAHENDERGFLDIGFPMIQNMLNDFEMPPRMRPRVEPTPAVVEEDMSEDTNVFEMIDEGDREREQREQPTNVPVHLYDPYYEEGMLSSGNSSDSDDPFHTRWRTHYMMNPIRPIRTNRVQRNQSSERYEPSVLAQNTPSTSNVWAPTAEEQRNSPFTSIPPSPFVQVPTNDFPVDRWLEANPLPIEPVNDVPNLWASFTEATSVQGPSTLPVEPKIVVPVDRSTQASDIPGPSSSSSVVNPPRPTTRTVVTNMRELSSFEIAMRAYVAQNTEQESQDTQSNGSIDPRAQDSFSPMSSSSNQFWQTDTTSQQGSSVPDSASSSSSTHDNRRVTRPVRDRPHPIMNVETMMDNMPAFREMMEERRIVVNQLRNARARYTNGAVPVPPALEAANKKRSAKRKADKQKRREAATKRKKTENDGFNTFQRIYNRLIEQSMIPPHLHRFVLTLKPYPDNNMTN